MTIQRKIDQLIENILASDTTLESEIDTYEYDLESVGTQGRTLLMVASSEGLVVHVDTMSTILETLIGQYLYDVVIFGNE